jgi:hypothetical protein
MARALAFDSFNRTVSAGSWGSDDFGQAWTIDNGTASNFSVSPSTGGQVTCANGQTASGAERAHVAGTWENYEVLWKVTQATAPASSSPIIYTLLRYNVATGPSGINCGVLFLPAGNGFDIRCQYSTNGWSSSTNVFSDVGSTNTYSTFPLSVWLRAQVYTVPTGIQVNARAWLDGTVEPTGWGTTSTGTAFADGAANNAILTTTTNMTGPQNVGIRARNGDTQANTLQYDQMTITDMLPSGILVPRTALYRAASW